MLHVSSSSQTLRGGRNFDERPGGVISTEPRSSNPWFQGIGRVVLGSSTAGLVIFIGL